MPHGNRWAARWAGVFVAVLGENAEECLACLKAMAGPVKAVSGALFGYFASRRLEKMLRESASSEAGGMTDGGNIPVEYAIRFITLLVEKNQFKHIDVIMRKIEERIDERGGTLTVIAESAAPLDSAFEEELKRRIIKQTGAANIKMETRVIPALLGGYRLCFGGFFIDASVKRQMEKMQAGLEEAL
jgi:F-type H+-transporting ATPase subunit delta